MKQYSIKELYRHLSEALKELPFEITNHNKVIAVVSESVLGGVGVKTIRGVPREPKEKIPKLDEAIKVKLEETRVHMQDGFVLSSPSLSMDEKKDYVSKWWTCEHGGRGRTCKVQKCRDLAIKKGDI